MAEPISSEGRSPWLSVCVCVFSFVTPQSCDFTTEQLPYWYMRYNGFVIHGKGQVVSRGGFPLGVGVIWVGSG